MTRHGRSRSWLALGLFVITIGLTAAGAWLHLTRPDGLANPDEWGLPGFEGILAVGTALVGLLIALKSSNPTGWIFTIMGLGSGAQYLAEEYTRAALAAGSSLPDAATAAWVAEWIWVPMVWSLGLLLVIFPDDRIGSRPGRAIAFVGAVGGSVSVFAAAFLSPIVVTWDVPNPYAISGDAAFADTVFAGAAMILMLSLVAAAIRLVARLRRATGVRRQQLKWFAYAAVFASVSLVFSAMPATTAVGSKFAVFGVVAIAVASAIAILKYRLYDIDVVINRTLVYGLLTAVLASVYVGFVFGFQAIMSPFTAESDLAIAASTLGVAALFRPVRSRVQDFIDRRFYRRKFDAEQTVAEFSVRLRDEVELSSVTSRLTGVVQETMQPAHVSLWMRPVVER